MFRGKCKQAKIGYKTDKMNIHRSLKVKPFVIDKGDKERMNPKFVMMFC
jgi:hypothetical protein